MRLLVSRTLLVCLLGALVLAGCNTVKPAAVTETDVFRLSSDSEDAREGISEIREAIRNDDLSSVKELTGNHPWIVRARIFSGEFSLPVSPLQFAASLGRTAICSELLSKGADADARSELSFSFSSSPLSLACQGGYTNTAKVLMKSGANVDYQDPKDGNTALMDVMTNIAAPDAPGIASGLVVLDSAALPIVKFLLSARPDLSKKNHNGETALDVAEGTGKSRCAELIRKQMKRR